MIEIDREVIQTDVLVAGGGVAGLMAAISAAQKGATVVVAEKANSRRSGCGATGNDHFLCYCPPVHGQDIEPILKEVRNSQISGFHDPSMTIKFLEESFERVKSWHEWGIDMRPHGDWEFAGHAFPGRPRVWLKYAGHNQKLVLTQQARRQGVRIENHLPIVDLITHDGRVVGALGLSAKSEKPVFKVIRAKSVVLATGSGNRIYPSYASPGWMFNIAQCPSCTGNAQALAYRSGARLVNMEFPARHAGPKFFNRCGKATWIGLIKDPHGRQVGPFVKKATRWVGDITADVWNSVFTDMMENGSGPSYMDCTGTTKEDLEYMIWGLRNEGNTGMLNYMAREGIDFRRHMIEFMQYEPFMVGRGVEIDLNAQTNLPGSVCGRGSGRQFPGGHRRGCNVRLDRRGIGRQKRRESETLCAGGETPDSRLAGRSVLRFHGSAKRAGLEGSECGAPADHERLRRTEGEIRNIAECRSEIFDGFERQNHRNSLRGQRPHTHALRRGFGNDRLWGSHFSNRLGAERNPRHASPDRLSLHQPVAAR